MGRAARLSARHIQFKGECIALDMMVAEVARTDQTGRLHTIYQVHGTRVEHVLCTNSSARQISRAVLSRATDHCSRTQAFCDIVRAENARIVFIGGKRGPGGGAGAIST